MPYQPAHSAMELAAPSIVWCSNGPAGSGKTRFAMTAPAPIAVQLFDPQGLRGVITSFPDKDIRVAQYNFNPGTLKESERGAAARSEWSKFLADWQEVLLDPEIRTIVWDKEDYVWELMRYADLNKVTGNPKTFYELNLDYRSFFHDVQMAGKNLACIRGMKEKWGKTGVNSEGKDTFGGLGIEIPRGQKQVTEWCEVNLNHEWSQEKREFVTTIVDKCRIGTDVKALLGQSFLDLDFPTLANMLYPNVDPEHWL